MQDSVGDVARKIMERTKTRIEISHNKVLKTSTYLISGKPENVARAKREICSKLSPQITKVIQVPALVRAQIVGMRGRTLQGIQTRTSTAINMPKRPASETKAGDSELFDIIDISISGDSVGVAAAVAEIEAIVDQRTTKRAVRVADIPHELNPLLIGRGGATLAALHEAHKDVQIRIPGPIDADQAIFVVGERDAVQDAIAAIRETARTLLQSTHTVTVTIPKRQHRFIVGEQGAALKEIADATGCSVIVPSPRGPSDQITVRGPESSLVQALGLVMSKANSVTIEVVDPTTIHAYERPLLYTLRALRYFYDRNRFRRIESEHGVTLRVPSISAAANAQNADQVQIEIQGKDARSVAAARQALVALFTAFPPCHFNSIDVEPHLHALLAGRDGSNVARLQASRSVYALFPKGASREILVVYEGFNPDVDNIASPADRERATRDLLRKTLEEFRNTIQSDSTYATKAVSVPAKLQHTLSKPAALEEILGAAGASEGASRVVVRFGAISSSAELENTRTTRKKDEVELGAEDVEVKGLAAAVDRAIAEINKRVKAAEEHERLHSFRDEFPVPQQLVARVIGRGGENIKRIRAERDISIDIADSNTGAPGTVKLQGTAEDVAAVKAEILEFVERMADQTSEIISVPANIHRSLIGTGGRYVKRLEEKYAVRIQFPSSRREADDEAGAALTPDQIRIRGGRKGVEGAKAELLELAAYEVEHNFTVKFSVPAAFLPHIVGKAGSHINEIKDESETRIDFADAKDGEAEVEATIVGTRAGVKIAREAIEAIVAEQASQVDVVLHVPAKHHRYLIGAGGGRVRELVTQAGGDPEIMSGPRSCRVQFPRASESTDEVKLKGDREVVEKVRAHIEELVAERERMTTIAISIPVSQHAFIIGRGGAQLKQLQDEHSVEIHFHSKNSRASAAEDPSAVRITGLPENCEACKSALLALVRDEEKVAVPLALHQRLGGRSGSLWRRVRSEFDVQVDAARVDKAPARRIDEANEDESRDVVYRDTTADLAGLTAEWILRGEKSKLAQALDIINKEVASPSLGVEARLRIEPRFHRHIIGKQGSNISKIRDATGCEVTVPKRGSESSWVTISGDRDGVERAIELIREAVEDN
ncbi:hypothetical protein GQ54DRAFT_262496 [Martensiomyces pterosporus]|nr:hypothetical protein GQ54DRAFT_262496 [Martensiomyces pterosporus]